MLASAEDISTGCFRNVLGILNDLRESERELEEREETTTSNPNLMILSSQFVGVDNSLGSVLSRGGGGDFNEVCVSSKQEEDDG